MTNASPSQWIGTRRKKTPVLAAGFPARGISVRRYGIDRVKRRLHRHGHRDRNRRGNVGRNIDGHRDRRRHDNRPRVIGHLKNGAPPSLPLAGLPHPVSAAWPSASESWLDPAEPSAGLQQLLRPCSFESASAPTIEIQPAPRNGLLTWLGSRWGEPPPRTAGAHLISDREQLRCVRWKQLRDR